MEGLESNIKKFIEFGYGYGSGYGYGAGYGAGYGYGDGAGDGSGDGYGYGYGSGSGYGDGSGDGDGAGSGDGYGAGDGSGDGYGSGYGSGDGYGYGYGDGDGVKKINGHNVYYIDGIPTLIDSVHRTYARGFILNKYNALTPCYVARVGNHFAHGNNLHQAHEDAEKKELQAMPVDKRIERFILNHPDMEKKYPAQDLFDWHGILTGSCTMGRHVFCKEHSISVETDSFTIKDFVKLTLSAYGGSVIQQIADVIGIET